MFGLLKQKLSGFLDKLTKKEDEKPSESKADGKVGREEELKLKEAEQRAKEEEAKKSAEMEAKKKADAEAKRKAEEEAKKSAEMEAKKKAEEERKAAVEAKKKADEDAKKAEEEMKKRQATAKKAAEEAARKEKEAKAEHDSKARKKAEEEMRKAQEAARKAEDERKRGEEEAKRLAQEAKNKAELERKAAEEEIRLRKMREEAEVKRKLDEAARRAEDERRKAADEAKRKASEAKAAAEEARKKEAEEAGKKEVEEARRKAEAVETERIAQEAAVAKKKAEEEAKGKSFLGNIWPFGKKQENVVAEKTVAVNQQAKAGATSVAAEQPSKERVAAPGMAEPQMAESIDMERLSRKAESGERKMEVKMGVAKTITSIFKSEIEITENDVRDLIDELELAMLEADVAYDVSVGISTDLRKKLVGMKVQKGNLNEGIRKAMADVLAGALRSGREFDFEKRVKDAERPVKILFIGPNGAGKTTTMAKVAKRLGDIGLKCVISASDTFRAAAIEQAEVHGKRLGITVIKSNYGSDPAAVAFDAIQHAKSNKLDVVLIDSSGRQDTNANLLDELKKMVRVSKPDIKIYIGESIGGNAVVDQIRAFNESVGLDGAILTKLDCDAKGGTALSVARATGVPVLFIGTGQGYDDLEPFDADKLAGELVSPSSAS